jgi:hypothetical protein
MFCNGNKSEREDILCWKARDRANEGEGRSRTGGKLRVFFLRVERKTFSVYKVRSRSNTSRLTASICLSRFPTSLQSPPLSSKDCFGPEKTVTYACRRFVHVSQKVVQVRFVGIGLGWGKTLEDQPQTVFTAYRKLYVVKFLNVRT